jgi:hypothetical protein
MKKSGVLKAIGTSDKSRKDFKNEKLPDFTPADLGYKTFVRRTV